MLAKKVVLAEALGGDSESAEASLILEQAPKAPHVLGSVCRSGTYFHTFESLPAASAPFPARSTGIETSVCLGLASFAFISGKFVKTSILVE